MKITHRSRAARVRIIASIVSLVLTVSVGMSCARPERPSPPPAARMGQVSVVYLDNEIRPENRDAIKKLRDSGKFESMADRLTKALVLPHDLQIVITDQLPPIVDDPQTDVDGRKIYWPAAFSKATHDVLVQFVPEVIASKGVPKGYTAENFTPAVLYVWSNQFILGHELGHAIIHQLSLPLTGMEEDSADGFATFFTVADKGTGTNAALGAAVLFDAMGSKRPNLTLEDFSSDHAVILQRSYNFLCSAVGSDPEGMKGAIATSGLVPASRALYCRKEWTQLNYGWWTVLEGHLTDSYGKETEAARKQARKDLDDENVAFLKMVRKLRGQE